MSRTRTTRWRLASPVGRMRVLLLCLAIVFSLCAGRVLQIQAFDAQAYATTAAEAMQHRERIVTRMRGDRLRASGALWRE